MMSSRHMTPLKATSSFPLRMVTSKGCNFFHKSSPILTVYTFTLEVASTSSLTSGAITCIPRKNDNIEREVVSRERGRFEREREREREEEEEEEEEECVSVRERAREGMCV